MIQKYFQDCSYSQAREEFLLRALRKRVSNARRYFVKIILKTLQQIIFHFTLTHCVVFPRILLQKLPCYFCFFHQRIFFVIQNLFLLVLSCFCSIFLFLGSNTGLS